MLLSTLQHKHQLRKHIKRWPIALVLGLDAAFFGFTDPSRVAAAMVMVGFGLFVANLYMVMSAFIGIAGWYGVSFGSHARRVAAVATGVISGAVALQSVGQLSVRDIIVVLPFAVILYMYTSYGQQSSEP